MQKQNTKFFSGQNGVNRVNCLILSKQKVQIRRFVLKYTL